MKRAWPTTVLTVLAVLTGVRGIRAQAGLLVPTSTGRADPAVISLREMAVDVGIAPLEHRQRHRLNVRARRRGFHVSGLHRAGEHHAVETRTVGKHLLG